MKQPVHGEDLPVGVAAAKSREGPKEEIESTGGWRKTPWLIRSTSVAGGWLMKGLRWISSFF